MTVEVVRTRSCLVAEARETEGVNYGAQNGGGGGNVQRPLISPPTEELDLDITLQDLWEIVQELTRQDAEMEKKKCKPSKQPKFK